MMLKHSNPHTLLLFSTLILSTLTLLSSTNWIIMWTMFEINLMSIIPMFMNKTVSYEMEAGIKYFLVQAISSSIMLMTIMLYLSSTYTELALWPLLFSILMKMGTAPCHLWVVPVMSNISWGMVLILSSWQKIGPLFLLSNLSIKWSYYTFFILITLNTMIGSLGGLNQTQMRSLLAYSSIAHMAWLMSAMLNSTMLTSMYFLGYSMIMVMVVMAISKLDSNLTSNLNLSTHPSQKSSSLMFLHLLSLSGMPPFLGFIPKWLVLKSSSQMSLILPTVLIIGSLISMFYYLNIFIASQSALKTVNMNEIIKSNSIMASLSLTPTPIIMMMV